MKVYSVECLIKNSYLFVRENKVSGKYSLYLLKPHLYALKKSARHAKFLAPCLVYPPRLPPGGSLGTSKILSTDQCHITFVTDTFTRRKLGVPCLKMVSMVPKIWRAVPTFLGRVNGVLVALYWNKMFRGKVQWTPFNKYFFKMDNSQKKGEVRRVPAVLWVSHFHRLLHSPNNGRHYSLWPLSVEPLTLCTRSFLIVGLCLTLLTRSQT